MNFLAHTFLSCSDETLLFGNFITDLLSIKELENYQKQYGEGIRLHRIIDSFTDAHPVSLELRSMLRPNHGKYASVVVDLIWDFCLSHEWSRYSGQDLRGFVEEAYQSIYKNVISLPKRTQRKVNDMIENDFLMAYSNKGRMLSSLQWMDRRARFPSQFFRSLEDLNHNESEIIGMFNQFFPEIIAHIDEQCNC